MSHLPLAHPSPATPAASAANTAYTAMPSGSATPPKDVPPPTAGSAAADAPAATRLALGGRVSITSLPCHSAPTVDPGPKRLMLAQGEFTLLHPACPTIRFCAVLGFPAGISRGGHYHRIKEEWLYVLHGRLRLDARHRQTGERFSTEVGVGDLIHVLPETEHRITTIEPGEMLEYSAHPHDPSDTLREGVEI